MFFFESTDNTLNKASYVLLKDYLHILICKYFINLNINLKNLDCSNK